MLSQIAFYNDIKGLLAFKEEYSEAQCLIVTQDKYREEYQGFPVIPVEQFLLSISPEFPIYRK